MTSEPNPMTLTDEQKFDLLEHPEQWPDDPALQAELAELLELHLGLRAHADDLDHALTASSRRWWQPSWLGAAAAIFLAVVPSLYAVQHARHMGIQRQDAARLTDVAQRRSQGRLWAAFLAQTGTLIRDFESRPAFCSDDTKRQDRNVERQLALALMERSQALAGQGAPLPEADALRARLHDWLREVYMEDGCMTPERVEELRRLAKAQNLEGEVARLSKMLTGGAI